MRMGVEQYCAQAGLEGGGAVRSRGASRSPDSPGPPPGEMYLSQSDLQIQCRHCYIVRGGKERGRDQGGREGLAR